MGEVVPIDIKLRQQLTALINSCPPHVLVKIAAELEKREKRQQQQEQAR